MADTMFAQWISEGLKQPNKDQYGLASALGADRSVVSKLATGKRQLKADEIAKVARYLETPPPAEMLPVRYTIGAGGDCFLMDGDEAQEYMAVSGMWGMEAEVGIVKGDSLSPLLNDGSRIIFGRARPPELMDHKHMRVVRLSDGRVMVKIMRRENPDQGIWTLESTNAPLMEGQIVAAVASIIRIEMA